MRRRPPRSTSSTQRCGVTIDAIDDPVVMLSTSTSGIISRTPASADWKQRWLIVRYSQPGAIACSACERSTHRHALSRTSDGGRWNSRSSALRLAASSAPRPPSAGVGASPSPLAPDERDAQHIHTAPRVEPHVSSAEPGPSDARFPNSMSSWMTRSAGRRQSSQHASSLPRCVSKSGIARVLCAGSTSGTSCSSRDDIDISSRVDVALTISTGDRTTSTFWPRSKRPSHNTAPSRPPPAATAADRSSADSKNLGRSSCSDECVNAAALAIVSGS